MIGLKKEDFDLFISSGQIQLQPARLIPILKTGDEMALTSILLSTIRLVKEFRDNIFKEIKLSRNGQLFYYTEAHFKDIDKSRIDGLIIVVIKGIIKDAAFFEMKNKNNKIDAKQIETYLSISKALGVSKLVTVSNEFVADSSLSPINVKVPKAVSLFHFSWTYLITKGQLLLFKNDENIEDEDQVEIMKESLHYFENPISGIGGYTQMKAGWKEVCEFVKAQKPLKVNDEIVEEAVLSWHEEEKDVALLLSRKLGVYVKANRPKDSLKKDIKKLVTDNYLSGSLTIKNAVSDLKIKAEFERRTVSMSVKVIPPQDKGNKAKINWIAKQLGKCKDKNETLFESFAKDIWIESDIKHAREHVMLRLSELDKLDEETKGKEIQAFHITVNSSFGAGFASQKKFIVLIEQMVIDYYTAFVQNLSSWDKPAPKIND